MKAALLGRKIGMTRVLDDQGAVTNVSVVRVGPCTVTQVRTQERDGYDAVQLGFEDVKPHRSTKPLIGHCLAAGSGPKKAYREVRLSEPATCEPGEVFTAEVFTEQEVAFVDVTGVCKGRGFTGVMRRHNFGGQQASHGVERKHRSPGSIGGAASLGRGRGVKKGKKMAGQFGNVQKTVRRQKLVGVDTEHGLLLIEGGVPGAKGGLLLVRQSVIG